MGYENEESAIEAVKYFNNTFINTSKIQVQICATLGEETKTLNKDNRKAKEEKAEVKFEPINVKPKSKIDEIIGEHKNDPQFLEFMKIHSKDRSIWDNDLGEKKAEEDDRIEDEKSESEVETEKLANKEEISDLDYMKLLIRQPEERKEKIEISKKKKEMVQLFTIKIRDIPKKIKREDLIKFFRPAKAHSVRIPTSGTDCYAYVGFKHERDLKRALLKDKSFLSE